MPFLYKGYNVNTIISSGNSSVPTTAYNGFPGYNPSNANVDLDKVKNPLLYQIANTDVVSNSNIQAASYKTPSSASGTYNVPDWCKGVKFYISSMKGSQGAKGPAGGPGAKGEPGDGGDTATAKGCMTQQANRKAPGGAGGDGGVGGDGGDGVYLYTTELIPVTGGESHTYSNNVSGVTTLKISNAYSFTTNNGNTGNNGGPGGDGGQGGKGGKGNAGSRNCPNGTSGNTGNTGSTGPQGSEGSKGSPGNAGNYSATNNTSITTGSSNTSEITVYFFTT